MKIPVISFFTGGGFLDIGFENAAFDVRWTNECNSFFADIYDHAVTTLRRAKDKDAPPAKISSRKKIEELKPIDVLHEAFGEVTPNFFGVIGGPPCTDFSVGGVHAGHDGKAGKLTSVYVRMLRRLRPTFFVLENVPHLESHPKHQKEFLALLKSLEAAGYVFVKTKLNALEFGVPQDRLRLFVVGFRRSWIKKWYPQIRFPKRALEQNFRWPEKSHPNSKTGLDWPTKNDFGETPQEPCGIPLELCVHTAVSKAPDPETLPNGKDYFNPHSPKFKRIQEGDVSGKSFKRLHRFRYSPTAWYGNNEVHLHPWKPRRLSVREALRLQSVPDEYEMPANSSLCHKFKVIGNGVPCTLATKLAASIHAFIVANERRFIAPVTRTINVVNPPIQAALRC